MACETISGKLYRLEVSYDAGTTYKYIGGLNSRGISFDRPVTDTTSQSTNPDGTGKFTASCISGYKTATISGSGLVDETTAANIEAYNELMTNFLADTEATFKLSRPVGSGVTVATYEGVFNITSLEETGDEQEKLTFTLSAQNSGEITYTVA